MSLGIHCVRKPQTAPYGMVVVFEDVYGNVWDLVEPHDDRVVLPKTFAHQADWGTSPLLLHNTPPVLRLRLQHRLHICPTLRPIATWLSSNKSIVRSLIY